MRLLIVGLSILATTTQAETLRECRETCKDTRDADSAKVELYIAAGLLPTTGELARITVVSEYLTCRETCDAKVLRAQSLPKKRGIK